jgi:hypothetical protein
MWNSIGVDCLHNGELRTPVFIPVGREIKDGINRALFGLRLVC